MNSNLTNLLGISELEQSLSDAEKQTVRKNLGINASLLVDNDGTISFNDGSNGTINIEMPTYELTTSGPLSITYSDNNVTLSHTAKYDSAIDEGAYKVGRDEYGHAILEEMKYIDISNNIAYKFHSHHALTYDGKLPISATATTGCSAEYNAANTTSRLALTDSDSFLHASDNLAIAIEKDSTDYNNWGKYEFISKYTGQPGYILRPNLAANNAFTIDTTGTIPQMQIKVNSDANMDYDANGAITCTYSHPSYTALSLGLHKFTIEDGHIATAEDVTKDDFMTSDIGIMDTDTTYTFSTGSTNGTFKIKDNSGNTQTPKIYGLQSAAYYTAGSSAGNIPLSYSSVPTDGTSVITSSNGRLTTGPWLGWAAFANLGKGFNIDDDGILSVKVAEPLSWDGKLGLTVSNILFHSEATPSDNYGNEFEPAFINYNGEGWCAGYITARAAGATSTTSVGGGLFEVDMGYATESGGVDFTEVSGTNYLSTTAIKPSTSEQAVSFTPKYPGIYRIELHIPLVSYDNDGGSYIHVNMRPAGTGYTGTAQPNNCDTNARMINTSETVYPISTSIHESIYYGWCKPNKKQTIYIQWFRLEGWSSNMKASKALTSTFITNVFGDMSYMKGYVTYTYMGSSVYDLPS